MDAFDALCAEPLDVTSGVPLHMQLRRRIEDLITDGIVPVGASLPGEVAIAESLGVSRSTVRRCMADLVRSGAIARRRGRGTVVAQNQDMRLDGMPLNFSARVESQGLAPSSRVLSFARVPASPEIARELELQRGVALWEVRRLRLAGGRPVETNAAYVPVGLCPELTEADVAATSLFALVAATSGMLPTYAEEVVEAVALGPREARELGVSVGSPAMRTVRVTYDERRRPYEAAVVLSRADRTRLRLSVGPDGTRAEVVSR